MREMFKEKPMLRSFIYGALWIPFAFVAWFGIFGSLILIFGIGDGYPSTGMKITGGVILLIVLMVGLILVGMLIKSYVDVCRASYIPVALKRTFVRTWVGIWIVLLVSFAGWKWIRHGDEMTYQAITSNDVIAYETWSRRRVGGDINEDLWTAARWGRLDIVKLLIERGADPNWKLGGNGDSVLKSAEDNVGNRPNGNAEVVKFLKERGAKN